MLNQFSQKIQLDIFDSIKQRTLSKELGSTVIVPHVCNNVGVFGAGFAAAVRNRFPVVATNFELLGKQNKLGYVQYISVFKEPSYGHEIIFANMIAQNGIISYKNKRPLNYEFLVKCMIDVRNHIKTLDKDCIEIHCPQFGSGLAGGNWEFISMLIDDIWKSISVNVYKKSKKNS